VVPTLLLALLLPPLIAHGAVTWTVAHRIHTLAEAPARSFAIVLGASVHRDGSPSSMLDERLRAAAELWHAQRVGAVLVSADHSPERGYSETRVMVQELLRRGVPRSALRVDRAGFRTFDSMWRARHVFGVEDAVVVTNPFHAARAVWLARQLGIDAVAVAADYGVPYDSSTRWSNACRETLARVLAFADVHLLGTVPRVTGPVDDGRAGR